MTNLEDNIRKTVGNTYGLRTWIEYGFKHAKNELRWADFRVTDYPAIERWWELVCCVYLLVSVQSPVFQHADDASGRSHPSTAATPPDRFAEHRWWDRGRGCKNILKTCGSFSSRMSFTVCSCPGCCCSISLASEQASYNSSVS
jgi:hypothetical protein